MSNSSSPGLRLLKIFIAAAAILIFMLLLAFNLKGSLFFVSGILLAGLFWYLLAKERHSLRRFLNVRSVLALAVVTACGAVLAMTLLMLTLMRSEAVIQPLLVAKYELTITYAQDDRFTLEEKVYPPYAGRPVDFETPQTVASSAAGVPRGFLLRELAIAPLGVDAAGRVEIVLPDNTRLDGMLCSPYGCPPNTITLADFPKNSFFAAKNAQDLQSQDYVDTSTFIWSVAALDDRVAFAYIPAPFNNFRSILAPFIGFSRVSQWAAALVGLVGALVVTPIVVPWINDEIKEFLQRRFKKPAAAPPQAVEAPKAKLIISADGEEKEIEVEQKRKDGPPG